MGPPGPLLGAGVVLCFLATCHGSWLDSTAGAQLGGDVGRLVAFGDFNADRRTDLFVVETNTKVSVKLAEGNTFNPPVASCDLSELSASAQIVNTVASDFNFDGRLDVLLAYTDSQPGVALALCRGNLTTLDTPQAIGRLKDQGLVMEFTGDDIPDIFGESLEGVRGTWVYNTTSAAYDFKPMGDNSTTHDPLAPGCAHAFVDLNADCLPDLFLVTGSASNLQGEIWLNGPTGFTQSKDTVALGGLPSGDIGQFAFADMDADGDMDIVFGVCHKTFLVGTSCSTSSMVILYNRGTLREQGCVARSDFGFDAEAAMSLSEGLGGLIFNPPDAQHPLTLHLGDYDFDGYPDVLAVMLDSSSTPQVALYHNQPCMGDAACKGRGLVYVEDDVIKSIKNPTAAAFFDYKENVFLDIVAITGTGSNPSAQGLSVLENDFVTDAFFVKVTVLNGKCISWCKEGGTVPNPEPLGVNAVGPTVRLSFDDVHGKKVVRFGGQFTQSSHASLQTPYLVFGLGRTNNYIDVAEVTVPYTLNKARNAQTYLSVIPNAQLVIIPNAPNTPENWSMKLFLMPSRLTLWIAVAVILACLLMGLVVLALHYKEKYEDEQEKRRTQHLFTYHAM
eukprot:comp23460_c0_seq1/m.39177 comp23460_c0_seq1/g.39177  ORF comp23460_c0_seq1/g.39177 comp23460_c0_seq1/m.39177 type:complete len:617 (-) comp23460_c0_seq1:778-2628(-)